MNKIVRYRILFSDEFKEGVIQCSTTLCGDCPVRFKCWTSRVVSDYFSIAFEVTPYELFSLQWFKFGEKFNGMKYETDTKKRLVEWRRSQEV